MPMLYAFGDVDDIACMEVDSRFAPLLIETFTTHANQYLTCTMMHMPVVATTGFEGNIGVTLNGLFTIREVLGMDRSKKLCPVKYCA